MKKSCCNKRVIVLKKRGNMAGFAKHLSHKLGEDPNFFTKCMADDETSGYDAEARKALCAQAHKLAIGRWPAQDPDAKHSGSKRKKHIVIRRK